MGLKEYIFGFKSEEKAINFLKKLKFEIIERNFKSKFGEIDIIAKKDDVYHFIEVKATKGDYEAIYRITPQKLEKILKTLNFYLLKNPEITNYQVDALVFKKDKFKFIENITIW